MGRQQKKVERRKSVGCQDGEREADYGREGGGGVDGDGEHVRTIDYMEEEDQEVVYGPVTAGTLEAGGDSRT